MIKGLTDGFVFPVGKDVSDGDDVTPQVLHDLAAALGARCGCKAPKVRRRKALDRVATSAAVMARARRRRLIFAQNVNAAMADADSPQ